MKVVALNGSPRKKWNTAQLLDAALIQAQQEGHETEVIHLYDYKYSGCRSCFACKKINSLKPAKCIIQDDATQLLEKVLQSDVVLFGSPIYFSSMTAQMQAFMERLWFPSLNYNKEHTVNYERKLVCGIVFTMNGTEKIYKDVCESYRERTDRLVGPTESFIAEDTMQFSDYSKYVSTMFDANHKIERYEKALPQQKKDIAEWMHGLLHKAANK